MEAASLSLPGNSGFILSFCEVGWGWAGREGTDYYASLAVLHCGKAVGLTMTKVGNFPL